MNNYLRGRTPIPQGGKINIDGIIYENLDSPSEVCAGSSCLVYHVLTYSSPDYPGKWHAPWMDEELRKLIPEYYILKEFYPILETSSIYRDLETNELIIDKDTKQNPEYQKRLKQFMQGVSRAQELSKIKHQFITIPYVMDSIIGDSHYVITEYMGKSTLKNTKYFPQDLEAKLTDSFLILEPFQELEELGYLMLDVKPDNILVDTNEDIGIRIVDTDSIYRLGDDLNDILLLSNARYAAPELKNLQLFSAEDANEIAPDVLTPYASMYSLGKYIFEYLWEEPFTEKNLSDYDREYLLTRFNELYHKGDNSDLNKVGLGLIDVLSRILVEDLIERMAGCYESISDFQAALAEIQHLYFQIRYPDFKPLSYKELDELCEDILSEIKRIFSHPE